MTEDGGDIGLVGLGTMGRNLILNMGDHGFSVVGYNRTLSKVDTLLAEAGERRITGARSVEELVGLLHKPRVVMIMVSAGSAVDSTIQKLLPHLEAGDVIIDGGNSHFDDTNRRAEAVSARGVDYLGMGVSGGEEGARYGPSLMPGGLRAAYERVREMFESVAAKVEGEPCITYLGSGSAGHYVKMVHNGIEYGIMQLLAESYDIMRKGLGLSNDDLHSVYSRWNQAELNAYLVEITAHIFGKKDDRSEGRLVDHILDTAKQKGTGKWTSQDALDLGVPTPSIDVAVTMRYMSAKRAERTNASTVLPLPTSNFQGDRDAAIAQLRDSLYVSMIIAYAQGMSLLQTASAEYGYDLDLEGTARIWRGGCIIRAALLEDIRRAYSLRPELPNLLIDPGFAETVLAREYSLRTTIDRAIGLAIPVPGFMAALSYLDSYRSKRLPANLIQAQRDYFGAHTYQRLDVDGTFHTDWGSA